MQRVTTVVHKSCGGIGPAPDPHSVLRPKAEQALAESTEAWRRVQPSAALDATIRLVRDTNEYLQDAEPWKLEPGSEVDRIMGDALEALRITALLISPATPGSAQVVWERIGLDGRLDDQRLPAAGEWGGYSGGHGVVMGDPLFPRLKG